MPRRSRSRDRRRSRSRRRRTPSDSSSDGGDYRSRRRYRAEPERQPQTHGGRAGREGPPRRHGGAGSAPYVIPPTAPRITVPANLPVEVSSFVDLFCLFVSRGGPLFEEEIKYREKGNPFFAFLTAPWNDPINVYYRWRLYSLLQEGPRQFMRWSTAPYQLEQGGKDALVWVPPPPIQDGIEHFSYLCDSVLLNAENHSTSIEDLLAQHQKPAASWLSRLVTNDETFFVALRGSDATQWAAMLALDTTWQSVCSDCAGTAGDAASPSLSLEPLDRFRTRVLSSEYIAERMNFAIEHRSAGVHVLSFVVDELLRHALSATALCEVEGRLGALGAVGPATVVRHMLSILSLLFVLHDTCRNAMAEPLSAVEVERIIDAEEEAEAAKRDSLPSLLVPSVTSVAGVLKVGSSKFEVPQIVPRAAQQQQVRNNQSAMKMRNPIIKGIEWIMPTVIESLIRVAVSCCGVDKQAEATTDDNTTTTNHKTHGVDVSVKAPASDGILSDHDPQPTVHVTLSSPQHTAHQRGGGDNPLESPDVMLLRKARGDMRIVAMQLLSWTRTLVLEWGDSGLVGSRCWLKLQSQYGFMICHPIEDVSG